MTERPKRIQLRRTKGWRKPEGAIVVARPTKWGNPWHVAEVENWSLRRHTPFRWSLRRDGVPEGVFVERAAAIHAAVDNYRGFIEQQIKINALTDPEIAELSGHDLACWCPLDQPCHADVLLELANGPES